jgi:hypothetical protein
LNLNTFQDGRPNQNIHDDALGRAGSFCKLMRVPTFTVSRMRSTSGRNRASNNATQHILAVIEPALFDCAGVALVRRALLLLRWKIH